MNKYTFKYKLNLLNNNITWFYAYLNKYIYLYIFSNITKFLIIHYFHLFLFKILNL